MTYREDDEVWSNIDDPKLRVQAMAAQLRARNEAAAAAIIEEKAAACPVQPDQLWRNRRSGTVVRVVEVRHRADKTHQGDVLWRRAGAAGNPTPNHCLVPNFVATYDPVSDEVTW